MNSSALAKKIAQAADDKKALDITVLDLRTLSAFTDFFVVCSGSSDRQVKTIANAIEQQLVEKNGEFLEKNLDLDE